MFPSKNGSTVTKLNMVESWKQGLVPKISGHSARRSGAMYYTRAHMALADISYLGRWKSSAVLRYIEDALQDIPLNRTLGGSSIAQPSRSAPIMIEDEAPEKTTAKKTRRGKVPQEPDASEPTVAEPPSSSSSNPTPVADIHEGNRLHIPDAPSTLWAISRHGRSRTKHVVSNAGWGLALDEWSTACGWKFARYHVKVELTKVPQPNIKECSKCRGWETLRDKVNGGVQMAQLIQL